MVETQICQRPDCGAQGKLHEMTDPATGKKVHVRLCEEDYKEARARPQPPNWLSELLAHITLVG